MPVEPATQMILDQMAAAGPVDFSEINPRPSATSSASSLGALDVAAAGEPAEDVEDRSIPGPGGTHPRPRLPAPPVAGPAPVVAFFHGGGWVIGDIDTHDGSCRILSPPTPGPWW